MPKLKTNKAARKRFKVTKSGKVLGSRSLRRHMMADRSSKNRRQSRQELQIDEGDAKKIKRLLPYGN